MYPTCITLSCGVLPHYVLGGSVWLVDGVVLGGDQQVQHDSADGAVLVMDICNRSKCAR